MAKLTRTTLGSIDNLIDSSGVVEVGKGTIEGNCWKAEYLRIITPEETRKINTPIRILNSDRNDFLEYLDRILSDDKLYFADVGYKVDKWLGFFSHKLTGRFYREKTVDKE